MVNSLELACDAVNHPCVETFDALVDYMDQQEFELAYALNALWDAGETIHDEWCAFTDFSNCKYCRKRYKAVTK